MLLKSLEGVGAGAEALGARALGVAGALGRAVALPLPWAALAVSASAEGLPPLEALAKRPLGLVEAQALSGAVGALLREAAVERVAVAALLGVARVGEGVPEATAAGLVDALPGAPLGLVEAQALSEAVGALLREAAVELECVAVAMLAALLGVAGRLRVAHGEGEGVLRGDAVRAALPDAAGLGEGVPEATAVAVGVGGGNSSSAGALRPEAACARQE